MKLFALLSIMLVTVVCFAVDLEVPEGDPLQSLLWIITNWSAASPIALGSGIIVAVVQMLRQFLPTSDMRRLAVVILGVAWATLQAMLNGLGVMDALVIVCLTGGGAVAIYEALKFLTSQSKKVIQRLG